MKLLLNLIIARNMKNGANQIAKNFFTASLADQENIWYYIISKEFYELISTELDSISKERYVVLDRQPKFGTYIKTLVAINKFERQSGAEVVYSLLAPSYVFFAHKEVMRCCNAWDVIDKDHPCFKLLDIKTRCRYRLKTYLVRLLMRRADGFVTQTEGAKNGIVKVMKCDEDNVRVVPNVLPLYFNNIVVEKEFSQKKRIIYVASPSPHKNVECVPNLAFLISKKIPNDRFEIALTIPHSDEDIWKEIREQSKILGVQDCVINLGGLSQKQLVSEYQKSYIGFFASKLETFSASLLEYMKFQLPIVSSDFSFNTEVAGDAALYFPDNSLEKAADNIIKLLLDDSCYYEMVKKGQKRLNQYSDFNKYYLDTVDFLSRRVAIK